MNEFENNFQSKVREIKEISGMSLHEMADATNIPYHTIKSWYYLQRTVPKWREEIALTILKNKCITRRTP